MPKKKPNPSPYTPRAVFFLTLCVVLLLTAAGELPSFDGLRTVDIYSHLRQDPLTEADGALETDDLLARFDDGYADPVPIVAAAEPSVGERPTAASVRKPDTAAQKAHRTVASDTASKAEPKSEHRAEPKRAAVDAAGNAVTPIENFSSADLLAAFFAKLRDMQRLGRPVRIAVLGDSFIEGDIFTQDLRELMQVRFGGRGVGFVPITSQVAGFRQSVGHSFSGWSTASIVDKPSRGKYLLSSYLYTPSAARSTVAYKGSLVRRRLDSFSRARLVFVNKGSASAKIEVRINEGEVQTFSAYPSERLAQVVATEDSIRSVSFAVSGAEGGFTAYGAYLDDGRGVCVDNYSVRGNSGVSMASIDAELMQQLNELYPIDMVVVQYGLNVAQADVKSYTLYQTQMQRVVSRLRAVLPGAVVVVMGIPDRTRRTGDGWATMPGVVAMDRTQRELARSTGVCYWSTLEAMKARGGMEKFVQRGWAAKDYTHLSARGGREIGRAFFDALTAEMEQK